MSTYIVGNHYAFIVMIHQRATSMFQEWWPQTEHEKSLKRIGSESEFVRYEILDLLCLGHRHGNDDVVGSDVSGAFVDQNGNHWYADDEDPSYANLYHPDLVGDTAESDAIASLSTKLGYTQARSVSRYLNGVISLIKKTDRFETVISGRPDEDELRTLFQAHVFDVVKAVISAGYEMGYRGVRFNDGRESSSGRAYYHVRYKKNRVTSEEESWVVIRQSYLRRMQTPGGRRSLRRAQLKTGPKGAISADVVKRIRQMYRLK